LHRVVGCYEAHGVRLLDGGVTLQRDRADDLCHVCDGISTLGLVHGSRINRGPGWNSTRFDRSGRRRPQPSVRRSEPESLSARDELAAATQRHDAALDSVGVGGAEHTHMRGDPDRCPYDRGSADDVRSAFGRESPGRGGDALPLINLERSTMNQQAVQERRRRGLNIAEVAFYSVLVLVIMLLSFYIPA
jgi:hypothetical protein